MIVVLFALVVVAPESGSARAGFNPNGQNFSAVEGVSFTGTVVTFTDEAAAGTGTYKATIDWGDGVTSDGKVTSTGKNTYEVTGTHTYAKEGTYSLHVSISGGSGGGESSPTATVTNAPLTVRVAVPAVTEGAALNATIATFTDLNPNDNASDYKAMIDWGDGSTSPGTITKTGPGAFSVNGSHTYAKEGPRTVRVTVNDAGGSTVTATQEITVANAPLTAGASMTLRGTEGVPLPRGTVIATFTDGNPAATDPARQNVLWGDYFSVTVNWGDGTKSSVITADHTFYDRYGRIVGSHTYRKEGRYKTTTVVKDKGGSMVTVHGMAIIRNAPLHAYPMRFKATVGKRFHGIVATFTDAKFKVTPPKVPAQEYLATITWGDGHSSAGTFSTVRVAGVRRFAVIGTHTYMSPGRKRVMVRVHDDGGSMYTGRVEYLVYSDYD